MFLPSYRKCTGGKTLIEDVTHVSDWVGEGKSTSLLNQNQKTDPIITRGFCMVQQRKR